MLKRKNKACITCGEIYSFCTGCAEFDHLPRWMAMYHNKNCKELFDITSSYLCGHITASEAKKRYEECDLSYKEKLREKIQNSINELLVDETKEDIDIVNTILDSFESVDMDVINDESNADIELNLKEVSNTASEYVKEISEKRNKTSKIKYVKQED